MGAGGRTSWSWPTTSSRPRHRQRGPPQGGRVRRGDSSGRASSPPGPTGISSRSGSISREIDEAHSSLTLVRESGAQEPLVLGDDAIISARGSSRRRIEAGLVFAGHGLSIPEAASTTSTGSTSAASWWSILTGAPAVDPRPAGRAHAVGRRACRLARSAGAIGIVSIHESQEHGYPLGAIRPGAVHAVDEPGRPGAGRVPRAEARRHDQPGPCRQAVRRFGPHVRARSSPRPTSGKPLPHFAIPTRLKATAAVKHADVVSQNVVAMLPGSDPKLKDEYVVFTAHLDHLGIGKPINGDAIYNGAMDNASGIAAMLDVAAMLKESVAKLRRSVLFVAVTGEEKGLLGSKFFANAPTVDRRAIVANLNTDMFMPLFPLKKLTIYGMDESDLGDDAAAVAESLGIEPQRDPEPKRNVFIRSDQYSFIRAGMPALALIKVGYRQGLARGADRPRSG